MNKTAPPARGGDSLNGTTVYPGVYQIGDV